MSKKEVTVQRWSFPDDKTKVMMFYSAEWCIPCQRIKPHVQRLQASGKIVLEDTIIMDATQFKTNRKIPSFDLLDIKGEKVIESIQTSKPEELDVFLNLDLCDKPE